MKNEPAWSPWIAFGGESSALPDPLPGIYEIAIQDGRLLKVGISKNLKQRLKQHRTSGGLTDRFGQAIDKPDDSEHLIKVPSELESHQSILAKHLYFDEEIASEYPKYDLKKTNGRHNFILEQCKFRYALTLTKQEARGFEIQLEDCPSYRYRGKVEHRRLKPETSHRDRTQAPIIEPAIDVAPRSRSSKNKMTNEAEVMRVESEMRMLFEKLNDIQNEIKERLNLYADNKTLKGIEIVGWLGEIYAKLLFDGKLVADSEEHDVVTSDNMRISVKTRRGIRNGWNTTSAIPKIDGEESPTHLAFVHLNDDYTVERIWLFEWKHLVETKRFKDKKVRGKKTCCEFKLSEKRDASHVIYPTRRAY